MHAQTVITMPPPAKPAISASPVMTMVAQAMERASHSEAGMDALYRYAHARQVPYNVYHVQPRGGMGSNLDGTTNWSTLPATVLGFVLGLVGMAGLRDLERGFAAGELAVSRIGLRDSLINSSQMFMPVIRTSNTSLSLTMPWASQLKRLRWKLCSRTRM